MKFEKPQIFKNVYIWIILNITQLYKLVRTVLEYFQLVKVL